MAEIDSLEIKITSEAGTAEKAINSLIKCLGNLSTSLKFDTSSLEKLGNVNGNNFKKLGEGLQSFANAAKSLQNVNSGNFNKLANGIDRIASIDPSKLEALGKIDGNSFRGLGEGVKTLSSGLQNLQGVKKSDFNRLATGIERLAAIQPGSMEAVGNALRPLADGINILSNAKFDNKNLTNLINSLTRLSNANTGSLASIDFSALGNSIKGLADTLSGAEKVQQNTISMTNAIAKLAGAGESANVVSAALPQLGEKLKSFMQTMAGAPKLESDTIAFTQALAQLANAGKKAESTASGLPKLGESLKNIFDTMSKMPTISENTIRMTQALAQLANAGGKAGNAAGNLNGRINTLSSSMLGLRRKTLKAVESLKNFAKQLLSSMGIYLGIYGAIRGAKKAIDISSDLVEVQNVVDVTFGDMAYKVEEFAQTSIEQFGMSELALKQYSSRFQAMGAAMGIDSSLIGSANDNLSKMTDGYISVSDSMADMSLNLTKLTADMASFYNVEQDIVAEKLASIFTGQTRPLRDFGLDLTQATLQEWALKQGMDVNIQSMSQAEKTMLRYQYVLANTTAAQGDFARTALTWANQVRILKQNFEQLASVIGGVLVNAFKPVVIAINKAMSAFIAFAKTISNSLGQIFGWTFEEGGGGLAQDFSGAADAADDMAGSLGDAGKAIDKMKAGLRAFDELKVISMPDDKNGGSGAGGAGGLGGAGSALGGQWVQGESILKKYESELDTLYKLGDYIGKKLTEAMDSIDWDSVYEKARNFGKGLADFLNGLVSPELFGKLGRTVAGALNTALYAALSFGETFDWKDFGLSIATGINNFFAAYDFAALAQTLNVWAKGILDTAITAIDSTDWKKIGIQIGIFLEGIDLAEIGMKIGRLIWKAINAGIDIFKGMFEVAPIEASILGAVASIGLLGGAMQRIIGVIDGLKTFFSPLTTVFSAIGEVLSTSVIPLLTGLSAPVLAVVAAITALVAGLGITYATNEEVRESFSQAVSTIKEGLQPAIEFVANTLLPDLRTGWEKLMEILSPLGSFLNDMFVSVWQDMINPALTYIGETVLPKLIGAFENLWKKVLTPLGKFLGSVLEPAIKIISDALSILWKKVIVPLADAIGNILAKAFDGIVDIFNEVVIPGVSDIITIFQFLWDYVLKPIADYLWKTFKPVFENVFESIGGIIDGLEKIFGGLIDFIVSTFTGDWERAWEGVKNIFKGIWNGIISIVEGVVNIVISGINSFLDNFDRIADAFGSIIGIDINIPDIPKLNLPKFAKGGITLRHTFAEIGEMNRPEAVLPLSDKKAMGMVADSIYENYNGNYADSRFSYDIEEVVYRATYNAVSSAVENSAILRHITEEIQRGHTINLDGEAVAENTRRIANKYTSSQGETYFLI